MGFNFFGGSTLFEKLINPAGWLHGTQTEDARKQAQAATEAAQAQAEAAKAQAAAQQQSLTLQSQQAALAASQGDTSNVTQTQSTADALGLTGIQRKRGADANITIGL